MAKVKPINIDTKGLEEMSRPRASLPNLETKAAEARNLNAVRAKETSDAAKKESFKEAFAKARKEQGSKGVFTWRGNTYNTKMAGEDSKPAKPAATRGTSIISDIGKATTDSLSNAASQAVGTKTGVKADTPTKPAARQEPRVGLQNSKLGRAYLAERASHAESNQELVDRYKKRGSPNLAKLVSYLSGAKYAKGGSVSKRADGCAIKGKTKGKMR
jgi:hypothetical protein